MAIISESGSNFSESSTGSLNGILEHVPTSYLLNPNDRLLANRFDDLISKHFNCSPFDDLQSVDFNKVFQSLEAKKSKTNTLNDIKIAYNLDNIKLNKEECLKILKKKKQRVYDNTADMYENEYGSSIQVHEANVPKPYIDNNLSIREQQKHLNECIQKHSQNELKKIATLNEDIEQQFSIEPLRISRRQKKKIAAQQRKQTLPNWLDMPRVTEISKEQEKDLLALKMRRVWDPKQFYKKSSQIIAGTDDLDERSRYFQIGTIQANASDYYGARLTKRERKPTIIDELMNDAQIQSYNKRKINQAMTRNSRLKIMMKRAKLRKMKRKIRERKEEKLNRYKGAAKSDYKSPHTRSNTFKTFEL
ncbi:Deoxynucleotidyltransferase terminal-interacting protein 2 [Sarcoptes scabiei]|uniref:Deoxynucleotidyltransferase terminal-interacting protein 2 n=1 Tax=Sarcoptes scabiei TaxID=52283 RepID=A0A834RCI0_SARSC|nr:Deoxynucleotidyltransferase terminal-interacting protein 2 [Sarcoptes scabiei]